MKQQVEVRESWVAALAISGLESTRITPLTIVPPASPAEGAFLSGFLKVFDEQGSRHELTPRPASSPRSSPMVRSALALVDAHFREPVTVSMIARRLRCHPVYLGREFKKSEGLELSSYVRLMHVGTAVADLTLVDDKIITLHTSTGFGSKASLFRAFALCTRRTPGYWRELIVNRRRLQTETALVARCDSLRDDHAASAPTIKAGSPALEGI